ncbi:transposase [Actinomadura sp. 7K534]|uniref:transposase n=1 Tax=Actinomadura sp. 7K534 TaxID=2530366 RepID=UPI0014053404|nr:transposase [Actinomadura sp. 7K534]
MPPPYRPEFRRRAVELARTGDKSVSALAKSLGISQSCLSNWIRQAAIEEAHLDGLSAGERKELAELRRKARQLELENEILKRTAAHFAREKRAPKIRYSLARELADNGVPVAVACRVLGVSRSGYTDWFGRPASIREQHNTELVRIIEDHGTQFTSWTFGKRLQDEGLLGSMGTIGDCCDNAIPWPAGAERRSSLFRSPTKKRYPLPFDYKGAHVH